MIFQLNPTLENGTCDLVKGWRCSPSRQVELFRDSWATAVQISICCTVTVCCSHALLIVD
ncbi:hypothetical protein PAXRUDRAFT_427169 [Paxillus rubicundulus Ve08.2h10]|uniref:Uncharacterized protein n=1 Tax=Paxillus rubicundulus Ve08.2h10 TaxID=930991 RepID=A0A0D0E8A6_9AGAM|nr:hypothetical protein PAXRUDRAFT_427169 [Paxillus rubicundulus Ve08.2h10]